MRQRAVGEVAQTEREVERGRVAARVSQVVDYIFLLLYAILAIRLLLELFAARESAGFVQFIKSLSNPFYAPFRGIVASPSNDGFTLALPIVVAIVAYMVLHLAINGLLRIVAHRKVEV
jgi:YGGT family.